MNCPVCSVRPGNWHKSGCGWEQCARCGGHLIGCEHRLPLDDRIRWTGACPWLAACLEFGFFEREMRGEWVACQPEALGSHMDLRRLLRECLWNAEDQRFVLPRRRAAA